MIFGAGALGKVALDIFQSHNLLIYGFLDDRKDLHGTEIGEVPVHGRTMDDGFLKFIGQKADAFVAEDDLEGRKHLVEMLNTRRKVMPMNALHSKAFVSQYASLGHGILINAGANIGPFAKLENHCLVHAGAVVDAEAQLGEYVQVSAGAKIGMSAKLEPEVFVGTGAVIVPGITIGQGARIGAGAVVIQNVQEGQTLFGNPAQPIPEK